MDPKLEYVSCPFNRQHRMLRPRLQNHIIKCKDNYPNYVPCIYNSLHWFENKEKMLEHVKSCPSQILVIGGKTTNPTHVISNSAYESRQFHQKEENWDDEYL